MKRSSGLQRKKPLQTKSTLNRTSMNRTRKSKAARVHKFWIVPSPTRNDGYTKELREYIKERDGWCRVCGRRGHEVHHVIPRGRYKVHPEWYLLNGLHDERNLMYICFDCHVWAHADEENLRVVIEIQEKRFGPLRKSA